MIRVLHIMTGLDGGISAVVLNYYKWLDRQKIKFDIAVTTAETGNDMDELKKLGADIYHIPLKSQGILEYEAAITQLHKQNHYDAVHVHESMTSYVALRHAKKIGIKQRLAHSHTTAPYSSIKGEISRIIGCVLNYHYATNVIGCGMLSGQRVFGKRNMQRKKAMVLPNAVDVERFAFKEIVREEMRNTLGIEDKFVVGMVARLSKEKNHLYALQLMEKLHKIKHESIICMVGDGEKEENLSKYINEHQMGDYVMMLGKRQAVERFYQAFDLFLMPSFHEGFPVAAVEAMAAGLPVLLSDTITKELSFGEAVQYIPLGKDDEWINAMVAVNADRDRGNGIQELCANNLDLRSTAAMLEKMYLNHT